MEKISLDLFLEYSFLSDLTVYKDSLLFHEYRQDRLSNDYVVKVHKLDLKTKEDAALTKWSKRNSFCVLDAGLYFKEYDKELRQTVFRKFDEDSTFTISLQVLNIEDLDDENYLILALIDKRDADYDKYDGAKKAEVKEREALDSDYVIFDEYPFFFNGEGIINYQRHALFLVKKGDFSVTRLTPATMDVESYDHDDQMVVYSGIDYDTFKGKWSKVYKIDLKEKTTSTIFDGVMQIGRVFLDDEDIVVIGTFAKDYGAIESNKFYVLKDEQMELVVDSEFSLYQSVGSDCRYGRLRNFYKAKDGAYLITACEGDGIVLKYHKRTLDVAMPISGTADDLVVIDDKLYVIAMKEQKLQEVYDETLEQLTFINEEILKDKYVARPEKLILEKPQPVTGWVLYPKDYDPSKKYPCILDIHGGPKCAYGEVFYHEMQYWASEGYFVIYCNPRGSDGYGNAFADLRHNYGRIDYEDLMDFVDRAIADYPIDPERLAVTGGSYGGYMTNWIIGHTDRFKAAASQRSISNWISMVCASDYGIDFPIEQEFDDLYDCQAELWDMSPLKYANKVKTPTLFIHSTEDYRCPIPEGIQMYTVLKCRGVDTRLVAFIGENHELSRSGKPLHRLRRLKEISEWLFSHLNKGGA